MTTTKQAQRNPIEALDELVHQVALDALDHAPHTAEDRAWSRALGAKLDARLAELRRSLTPPDVAPERAKPLRPSTLALTRDALMEAITRLTRSMGGAVQYAHRNLRGLSDDDLRRLLDTIDPTARHPE